MYREPVTPEQVQKQRAQRQAVPIEQGMSIEEKPACVGFFLRRILAKLR